MHLVPPIPEGTSLWAPQGIASRDKGLLFAVIVAAALLPCSLSRLPHPAVVIGLPFPFLEGRVVIDVGSLTEALPLAGLGLHAEAGALVALLAGTLGFHAKTVQVYRGQGPGVEGVRDADGGPARDGQRRSIWVGDVPGKLIKKLGAAVRRISQAKKLT